MRPDATSQPPTSDRSRCGRCGVCGTAPRAWPARIAAVQVLSEAEWRGRERAHQSRAESLTAEHLARKQRGEAHPVEDFLWNYYFLKPSHLHRWHPGLGVLLERGALDGASDPPRYQWRFYSRVGDDLYVDGAAVLNERGTTACHVDRLIRATLERPGRFGCFGLHEWAMVYRQQPNEVRHQSVPLRLPNEAIDGVVDSHQLACTHFDAYRFFTPEAAPLNTENLTRETQVDREQPGCLHAGMDLYKWAGKLGPVIPGELLLDTFELARAIREVDMQASPYDVSAYRGADGEFLTPIAIETAEGKRDYVARQREFTLRGNALRQRILEVLSRVPNIAGADPASGAGGAFRNRAQPKGT